MKLRKAHKQRMKLLLSAMFSVALLFSAAACSDNNNTIDTEVIPEDQSPDINIPNAPDINPDAEGVPPAPDAS